MTHTYVYLLKFKMRTFDHLHLYLVETIFVTGILYIKLCRTLSYEDFYSNNNYFVTNNCID